MAARGYNPQPMHAQIAAGMRRSITEGIYPPGAKLPSTKSLAAEWEVAENTVRAAVDELRREGAVISMQGRGVFVRPSVPKTIHSSKAAQAEKDMVWEPLETRRNNGTSEWSTGRSVHSDGVRFKTEFSQVPAEEALATRFGIELAEPLLQRTYETWHKSSGLLEQWSRSWLVIAHIAENPALLDPEEEPWPGGTQHQLSTVGIEVDHVDTEVTGRMPVAAERESWGIDDAVPMLEATSTMTDTTGRIVVVSQAVYPSDRTRLDFHIQLRRW